MNELGTTKQEVGWAPEPVQTVLGKKKSLTIGIDLWLPSYINNTDIPSTLRSIKT